MCDLRVRHPAHTKLSAATFSQPTPKAVAKCVHLNLVSGREWIPPAGPSCPIVGHTKYLKPLIQLSNNSFSFDTILISNHYVKCFFRLFLTKIIGINGVRKNYLFTAQHDIGALEIMIQATVLAGQTVNDIYDLQ